MDEGATIATEKREVSWDEHLLMEIGAHNSRFMELITLFGMRVDQLRGTVPECTADTDGAPCGGGFDDQMRGHLGTTRILLSRLEDELDRLG